MNKTTKLTYTIDIHKGILDVRLVRDTFWDKKIHLFEAYEESYIHYKVFVSHYYQSFGNIENINSHTVFDYLAQNC